MNLGFARNFVISVFCSLALIGSAIAQTKDEPKTAQKKAMPAPPVAGIVELALTVEEQALVATGWRASKLIHAEVSNDQKQKIGKVDDLLLTSDGKLSAAVIQVGGFLGVGSHLVLVSVNKFSQIVPSVILPGATKEALKALPQFKYAK